MLCWMLFKKSQVLSFHLLPAYEIFGFPKYLAKRRGNSRVFPRQLVNPQWVYCRNKLNSLTHSKWISEPSKTLQRMSRL